MHAFIEKLVNMTTGANPGAHKILIVTDCVHGNINVAEHKSVSNISMSLCLSLCKVVETKLCNVACVHDFKLYLKIEYHVVGDTWWQPLLSYGK